VLQFYRKSLADFPMRPFLVADPVRKSEYREKLKALPGKKVGICWRSMMLTNKRAKYFASIEQWAPLLKTPGVSFVNLQYGDVASELQTAREKFGIPVHNFEDLNLKNDLESAAALTDACDLVISAPTAAAAMAGALGRETWFLVASRVWPQLGTDHYPWYRSTRVFACEKFADWDALMPSIRDALQEFAAGAAIASAA